jgi:hypothetical protein
MGQDDPGERFGPLVYSEYAIYNLLFTKGCIYSFSLDSRLLLNELFHPISSHNRHLNLLTFCLLL